MANEASVQSAIRLEADRLGVRLWRNNSGAAIDQNGRAIRYGLANDSAAVNALIKSPDLVGLMPVLITPDLVGRVVGLFVGIECKSPGWHLVPSDARAAAQQRFHDVVREAGGVAGFASSLDDFHRLIGRE